MQHQQEFGYFTRDTHSCYTSSIAIAMRKRLSRSLGRPNGKTQKTATRRVAENRRTPDEFHQPPHKPVDALAPGSNP